MKFDEKQSSNIENSLPQSLLRTTLSFHKKIKPRQNFTHSKFNLRKSYNYEEKEIPFDPKIFQKALKYERRNLYEIEKLHK